MRTALKLYKILTWFILILSSTILLFGLLALLMSGSLGNIAGLLLFGTIFLHAFASTDLIKAFTHPGYRIKENTGSGIRIMGWVSLLLAIFMMANSIAILTHPQIAQQLLQQLKAAQPATPGKSALDMSKIINGMLVLLLVFGLSIAVNINLSFFWFKVYKQQSNAEQ